jgi:hypothetical protein
MHAQYGCQGAEDARGWTVGGVVGCERRSYRAVDFAQFASLGAVRSGNGRFKIQIFEVCHSRAFPWRHGLRR